MTDSFRRYEILLPQQFNDGRPVPDELLGATLVELRQRFGAISCETQSIQGVWEHAGTVYDDRLTRLFIDVVDTEENHRFFKSYKEELKKRFQQLDIWMTSYPVDVV